MRQSKSLAGVVITGAGQNFRLVYIILSILISLRSLTVNLHRFGRFFPGNPPLLPPLQLWERNPGS
jgi:hypothetical protein